MKVKEPSKEPKKKTNKEEKTEEKTTEEKSQYPLDSDEEEGFSKWLHSSEGLENLKLFVIGNSVLLILLISWPQMKEALEQAYYMFMEYMEK